MHVPSQMLDAHSNESMHMQPSGFIERTVQGSLFIAQMLPMQLSLRQSLFIPQAQPGPNGALAWQSMHMEMFHVQELSPSHVA